MHKVINYFKESVTELNRVNWPDRAQTIKLTLAVAIFSVVLALFMGIIDVGLNEVVKKVILKS